VETQNENEKKEGGEMRRKEKKDIEEEEYEFLTLLHILRGYSNKKLEIFLDTLQALRLDESLTEEDLVREWVLARLEVET
jgi:hypothetical protein